MTLDEVEGGIITRFEILEQPNEHGQAEAALAHHQAGRNAEAEQLCRQIIAVDPSFAGAWHLLALLAGRSGI